MTPPRLLLAPFLLLLFAILLPALSSPSGSPTPPQPRSSLSRFDIHGWRWHSLSLRRDCLRLASLASLHEADPSRCSLGELREAAEFVDGFNHGGLRDVEEHLFFPWLEAHAFSGRYPSEPADAARAREALAELKKQKAALAALSEQLPSSPPPAMRALSLSMSSSLSSILSLQDSSLVPFIAATVPLKEQSAFASRVIRRLGVLAARAHLVGMRDAAHGHPGGEEGRLFEERIPGIARRMIPGWRRGMYKKRAGRLEDVRAEEPGGAA